MRLETLGKAAKAASYQLASLSSSEKNAALEIIACELESQEVKILSANSKDIAQGRDKGLAENLLDRLALTPERLAAIIADVRSVIALPDPVGSQMDSKILESGLSLSKRRVPIGVIGVIYEARPNVTIDVAALCLKTGNASILRGGKETLNSNLALIEVIQAALEKAKIPSSAIQYIEDPDRALVSELLTLDRYVDMIIPRGGAGLHQLCKKQSTIPVITGGIGVCHIYVDESADHQQAIDIIENAKVQRPSVCNALDTLLVNKHEADVLLPLLAKRLNNNVLIKADGSSLAILKQCGYTNIEPATTEDFDQEWLSLTLGIKVVDTLAQALEHIREHSTEHSDAILTNNWSNANTFTNVVNSAAVYVNASTRFTDGSQFGLGAEVAVSTQKLHARGPMGLEELTTYKWIGIGNGLIRK